MYEYDCEKAVEEQIAMNKSKLEQMNIAEKTITTINMTNNGKYKMKAYNTGVCVISSSNFNYILNMPKEYTNSYTSQEIKMNDADKIYFTYFNSIVCTSSHCYIRSKTQIKKILLQYFKYLRFIQSIKEQYQNFINKNIKYRIKGDTNDVFLLQHCFIDNENQDTSNIIVENN